MLKNKFMTVCTGCNGDGKLENEVLQMGEVNYYYTKCDCENGVELDWQKVNSEIKNTKEKIEINLMSIDNHNKFMREAMRNKDEYRAILALKLLMEHETKIAELEDYLAELETID
jgi:hypothetical protein